MDNLKSNAYKYLKEKILSCELLPGQKLSEKDLMDEIGVGRTPVREALLKLEQEDMVTIRPRAGTYVKPIAIETINELYQLRKIIEPATAVMVKEQIDNMRLLDYCDEFKRLADEAETDSFYKTNALDLEFHKYIVSCTQNNRLIEYFTTMMESVYRLSIYNALNMKNNAPDQTYAEHYAIAQAIVCGDDEQIRKTYLEHLSQSQFASITAARMMHAVSAG